jgi:hypothetical protein
MGSVGGHDFLIRDHFSTHLSFVQEIIGHSFLFSAQPDESIVENDEISAGVFPAGNEAVSSANALAPTRTAFRP